MKRIQVLFISFLVVLWPGLSFGQSILKASPKISPKQEYHYTLKKFETEKESWIEIELIDDEGNPVPSARYVIQLPDGSTREGQLDSNGCAKEENIPPGDCYVFFPELDMKKWERLGKPLQPKYK